MPLLEERFHRTLHHKATETWIGVVGPEFLALALALTNSDLEILGSRIKAELDRRPQRGFIVVLECLRPEVFVTEIPLRHFWCSGTAEEVLQEFRPLRLR